MPSPAPNPGDVTAEPTAKIHGGLMQRELSGSGPKLKVVAVTVAPMASVARVGFIWSVADLLRGDYRQSEHGKVILPLTVLRRLDRVLEPTKEKVLERANPFPRRLTRR